MSPANVTRERICNSLFFTTFYYFLRIYFFLMLIKMSFKRLVDVLGYIALLKRHIKSEYLFRWKWGTAFTDKRASRGGLTNWYRKSAWTPFFSKTKIWMHHCKGHKKIVHRVYVRFFLSEYIFFAFAGDDFKFSITEMS